MKKVINTYIVNYEDSFADNELAILFELKDGTFVIKYDGWEMEKIKVIDRKIAEALIK
jgi:hypothetical protein